MAESDFRFLIVDDEPGINMLLKGYVRKEIQKHFPNAEIESALSLEVAASIIRADPPPDVVLLDLSYPTSTMSQTLDRLDEFERRSVVVLITGNKRPEVEAALGGRVIEILEKDSHFWADLFHTIARAVNARRDAKSEERLKKIDDILQEFYSTPNAYSRERLSGA